MWNHVMWNQLQVMDTILTSTVKQNFCLSSMGMYTVNNWLSAVALTYILLVIWCGSYSRAALIQQRRLFQKWVKQWLKYVHQYSNLVNKRSMYRTMHTQITKHINYYTKKQIEPKTLII